LIALVTNNITSEIEVTMVRHTSAAEIIQRAFPGIRVSEAEAMAGTGEVHTYPSHNTLCMEGSIEEVFYIILAGEVKVSKLINEVEVRELTTLQQGDFFGEMALIHDAPRAATVTTTQPTTVLEISKDEFEKILRRSSSVSLAMVREVSRRLRENDEMAIEDLRFKAKELAAAYQQLAEQDYARQEFLTTIAHEIRMPLTASYEQIQSIAAGLVAGEEIDVVLDNVGSNLQRVITLVNDILFLQEMDLILLEFEPTDIGEVVSLAVNGQRDRAIKGGVNLVLEIAPDLPRIMADGRSLERVVNILLDNAIKFSPNGGDTHISVNSDETYIWVRVQDDGVGIPSEAIPRLYRRYFRIDEAEGHLFSGAGLGLSIARQVVEQHGGWIDVQSVLGEGSTFTIFLHIEGVPD
jgi:signal transduction histidine kinase